MRLFGLAALALVCACSGSPAGATVGKVAPDWTLPTANGGHLALASYRGKAVYLNFFATWCPPCNAEAPDVNALARRYASRGLRVIGIDEQESAQKAQGFVKKFGLVYPAVIDEGSLGEQYKVNGLPVHVFIKQDGTIAMIRAGEMTKAEIESEIRAIL
ncbi:MAG: TlpA family protein disulfide reductase [Candidatus Eremiobacteraeota bacterium]|nr:TlpA family protein disulfide reductase [Candidatus Eremiobacteraeota bacterium]